MFTKILVRKPEWTRQTGRSRHRWVNSKMDLKEIYFVRVDYIHLAQDRVQWSALVNMVMEL
jgi:hypothetical protein